MSLTQRELARKIGIAEQTISDIKHGRRGVPKSLRPKLEKMGINPNLPGRMVIRQLMGYFEYNQKCS